MNQKNKTLQEIKNSKKHRVQYIKSNNGFSAGMYWNAEMFEKPDNNIAIFRNDSLIFVIKNKAIDFCWIPKKNDLVYLLTDTIVESGVGAPANKIGVFHANSLKNENLYEIENTNEIYLKDVEYADFDKNIYLYNFNKTPSKVFRLDKKNKALIPTDYLGIYFSPNGEYYVDNSLIENPIVLYSAITNKEIWNSRKANIPHLNHILSWYITDSENYLFLSGIYGVAKINCKNGNLIKFYKKSELGKKPFMEKGTISWR